MLRLSCVKPHFFTAEKAPFRNGVSCEEEMPVKKVKIGVMGAFRGLTMIKFLMKYGDAELVAVCDKYRPALEKVRVAAQEAGMNVALYENFDDFLRCDMEAVVLANYATEHAPFAIRCLKSGRRHR